MSNLEVHALRHRWVFWFTHRPPGVKSSAADYANQLKKVGTVFTVENFWHVYQHLKHPSEVPVISDFQLFRDGIMPVWEDEANVDGGKWIVRLRKGVSSRMWENLVLAIIGEQFQVENEICGAVLSLRSSEDIISVWNKNASLADNNLKIRDIMKQVLGLPQETVIEYKAHKDALVDQSSFRNTDVFK